MNFWNWIKNFSVNENWGDKPSPLLVYTMDMIRANAKKSIVVHCAYATSGHTDKSQHYKGLACDFHFIGCEALVPLFDIIEVLDSLYVPYGLGYYKDWRNHGYHVDICRKETTYWIRDGKYTYFSKNDFLKELGKVES